MGFREHRKHPGSLEHIPFSDDFFPIIHCTWSWYQQYLRKLCYGSWIHAHIQWSDLEKHRRKVGSEGSFDVLSPPPRSTPSLRLRSATDVPPPGESGVLGSHNEAEAPWSPSLNLSWKQRGPKWDLFQNEGPIEGRGLKHWGSRCQDLCSAHMSPTLLKTRLADLSNRHRRAQPWPLLPPRPHL